MLRNAEARGYKAWFNVHRIELVRQSVATLTSAAGLDVGVVAPGFQGNRHLPVQVCSIATLRHRRSLLEAPNLIVWDEAHHCAAKTWADIHEAYPRAVHVGLSATPERLDGTGLGRWFNEIIVGPSVAWLIEHDYLSDYRLYAPKPPDLSGVHTVAGDYNRKELTAAMNLSASTVTGDVITHYQRYAKDKRMVLFAWSIESSMMLAERFRSAGIAAEHVDGTTDASTREGAMERFKAGETKVLANVDLFSEGVDVPAIEAVALLRPTQSLALYMQQVGRALRPAIGKTHAIILDHAGNCQRFGLPDDERTWSLEGRKRSKTGDYAVPIRQCPRCFAVSSAAADTCRACGFKFVAMPREIEQVEGELSEVEAAKLQREQRLQEQGEAKSLDDLMKLARLRGYKNPEKWAHQVYKHRMAKQAAREAMKLARNGMLI